MISDNNPIPRSSFWATPHSLEDLQARLKSIGNSEEQRIAFHAAMLALNWAHLAVEEANTNHSFL